MTEENRGSDPAEGALCGANAAQFAGKSLSQSVIPLTHSISRQPPEKTDRQFFVAKEIADPDSHVSADSVYETRSVVTQGATSFPCFSRWKHSEVRANLPIGVING